MQKAGKEEVIADARVPDSELESVNYTYGYSDTTDADPLCLNYDSDKTVDLHLDDWSDDDE